MARTEGLIRQMYWDKAQLDRLEQEMAQVRECASEFLLRLKKGAGLNNTDIGLLLNISDGSIGHLIHNAEHGIPITFDSAVKILLKRDVAGRKQSKTVKPKYLEWWTW